MENVVKNESSGYGYNYASLGDIAKQGFTIPKMKTGTEDGHEYVYYKDGEEWLRGAEVVIPESKQMNKAQLYGSALTYARRYTTLMALQLACDDDKEVEDLDKKGERKTQKKAESKPAPKAPTKTPEGSAKAKSMTAEELIAEIKKLYREDEIKTLEAIKQAPIEQFSKESLEAYYDHRKGKKTEPEKKEEMTVYSPEKPFY